MFLLMMLKMLILFLIGWALVFEVLVPLATNTPLFPMFRTKPKEEGKSNVTDSSK